MLRRNDHASFNNNYWRRFLEKVAEETPSLGAIMENAQLIDYGDDTVTIEINGGSQLSRDLVLKGIRVLRNCFADVTGGRQATFRIQGKNANGHNPKFDSIVELFDGNITKKVERKFPETMKSFKEINSGQYELFAKKQHDYGPGNISMGGNKELSLLALAVRMNDKVQRLLNILHTNNGEIAVDESLKDTFQDLSVYGVIAQIVMDDKWGK
jgi:hypothetical protein|tara:strand:+ start:2037 stop:2672 length:636 start_codon:yes stop_codon:yes gene_type:complete